ncbi:hypothetical protein P5V15_005152 [Pogonomyrmex californicus]
MMKENKRERGEKEKEAYITREIYIAFKSLERLIIIVITSRRNIGEKKNGHDKNESVPERLKGREKQVREKEREKKNPNGDCMKGGCMRERERGHVRLYIYIIQSINYINI